MADLKKICEYSDLGRIVDQHGGVLTIEMGQLRDIHKAGKLGSTVVANISKELDNIGLGHSPVELPRDQYERALVYRKGSRVAEIVEAITRIREQSDAVLRKFASNDNKDTETLRRIRELIND